MQRLHGGEHEGLPIAVVTFVANTEKVNLEI
jgi:hypothetical protein